LGIKQIEEDPFNQWTADNKKGAVVKGKVIDVDAKGATVSLIDGVEGYIRASEASRDRVEDATLVLTTGDEVEAKFTGVDRKNRVIHLSVKAKDAAEEQEELVLVLNNVKQILGNNLQMLKKKAIRLLEKLKK
jgi:small subunit ribosomal protein S1